MVTSANKKTGQDCVKLAQNVDGVEIHYVWNTITGALDDFKFVGAP